MKKLASPEKVKRSGIRAINQGTRYDLTGCLRRLTREIERGEHVDVRAIGVVIQQRTTARSTAACFVAVYGEASDELASWMFSTAKHRTEPV